MWGACAVLGTVAAGGYVLLGRRPGAALAKSDVLGTGTAGVATVGTGTVGTGTAVTGTVRVVPAEKVEPERAATGG